MTQSFLFLAADRIIEALVGELVGFAGHTPAFPRDDESGAGAIRKRPPFGVLLDASQPDADVEAVVREAREQHVVVVYFASCMSSGELRAFAEARRAMWFALPNGPNLVSRVLGEAIAAGAEHSDASNERVPPINAQRREAKWSEPSYNARTTAPAISAALVALQRADVTVTDARSPRKESRLLRTEGQHFLAEASTSHSALRDAVLSFASRLRAFGVLADDACDKVKTLVFESAVSVTDERTAGDVARAALDWVSEVYAA